MASLARFPVVSARVATVPRCVATRAAPPASVGQPADKYAVIEIGGVQKIVEEGR